MALDTVQDYIDQARVLLQDESEAYRYPDADLVAGINLGISEAARVRPDLFFKALRTGVPADYSASSPNEEVEMDARYRVPLLYFVVGYATLRDQEDNQDDRAAALLNKFVAQLISSQA